MGCAGRLGENLVEVRGPQDLAFGERIAEALEEVAQRIHLLRVRCVMDAVEAWGSALCQALGGGHVGLDHEFLDQAVAVMAWFLGDTQDRARVVDANVEFGHRDIERLAPHPFALECHISVKERRDHRIGERPVASSARPSRAL